ncbi:MAG: chromate transporter [Prevotellaceae bacterium]|jgi:chromate transporter|nr:chromate transporter [Prevotellaceae bacterium]
MIYLKLLYIFFKIGLFGFGGGYGMLSLIQFEVVEKNHFLTVEQFADIVAISQATPGPIGINCATYVGFTASGNVFGSAVATIAVVLPSFILMLILAKIFVKFQKNIYFTSSLRVLRMAVVGLIAAAALMLITEESFGKNYSDIFSWAIFAVTFAAVKFLKINPIAMILIAGVFGLLLY